MRKLELGDAIINGKVECPECGEELQFKISGFIEEFCGNGYSGMIPQSKISCKNCKTKIIVESTITINKVE